MLARVDAGRLRRDAGISQATVGKALGVPQHHVSKWERGQYLPCTAAGFRWIRFVAGLERHAEVTAELRQHRLAS